MPRAAADRSQFFFHSVCCTNTAICQRAVRASRREGTGSFGDLAVKLRAHLAQTELPPDYIELEKRVDALKQVHQKLLSVTLVAHS